jgi:CheY-like chemotaxis protein
MLTRKQFQQHLREGLGHLHDPESLCRSPLAAILGVAHRSDTYSALQAILTEAIAALEPGPAVPSDSRAWRIYELLTCRYVQEQSAPVVAHQLGLSIRHLRREQGFALEALTNQLWERFDLEKAQAADRAAAVVPLTEGLEAAVKEELAWVQETHLKSPTDLAQALYAVVDMIRPLAAQHKTDLVVTMAEPLPGLAVHPVALDHILLGLLSAAIHQPSGGQVRISAKPQAWEVEIKAQCATSADSTKSIADGDPAELAMIYRLADLCRGKLTVSTDGKTFTATLVFPAFEQLPVLVIDDNADTLQLLKRYTAGTRYRLVGTPDPEQALSLAEKVAPQIIVLDVMMPDVDGWRVLGRLRQHPLTSHIPFIVCTILMEEKLALLLGASSFLRKPVTRQAFLAALDAQVARVKSESGR